MKILVIIISFLSLVGCNNEAIVKGKPVVKEVNSTMEYIGMRLNDETVSKESNSKFEVKPNAHFTPSLEVLNGFSSNQSYRVIFLVDYQKPILFSVDGQSRSYIDLNIKANSTKKIDVTFPKLVAGQHYLTTIIIRDPDKILKEPNFIPGFEHILAYRANIIVSTNAVRLPSFFKVEPHHATSNFNGMIILSQDPTKNSVKPLSLIRKNFLHNIWLNFENKNGLSRYAVIILNLRQVKSEVKFVSTNSKGIIRLPINLSNNIQCPTNLVVLAVENPFSAEPNPPLLSNKISIIDWTLVI